MPEITYQGKLPSSSEFRQVLAQALNAVNPVDDLLDLSNRLRDYEQKYGLSSAEYYRRYQAGDLTDELQHAIAWAALYETFLKTKRLLEAALMRAAVQPELSTSPA
jgi:hypothetical protein